MFIFNNKQYPSIKAIYDDNLDIAKVTYTAVMLRYKKGWSIKDALEKPKVVNHSTNCYIFRGKKYSRGSELFQAVKPYSVVSQEVFLKRLFNGWSVEKAYSTSDNNLKNKDIISFEGKHYNNLNELYRALQNRCAVNQASFIYRIKHGWTIEEALKIPKVSKGKFKPQKTSKIKKIDNTACLEVKDVAKAYNNILDKKNIYRTKKHIIIKPIKSKELIQTNKSSKIRKKHPFARSIILQGIKYPSKSALAKAFNIPISTLNARLKRGLTLEQALKIK